MRRHQASIRPDLSIVDPDGCLPVRPFQRKDDSTTLKIGRNLYLALIPGDTNVMARWLRKKRHPHLPRVGICLVILSQVPVAVIKRRNPGSFEANLITEILRLQDAGKLDRQASQRSFEYLCFSARIRALQHHQPVSRKIFVSICIRITGESPGTHGRGTRVEGERRTENNDYQNWSQESSHRENYQL